MQVGAFSVLKELVVVLPDCLTDHIGSLIPGIEKALTVSNIVSSWNHVPISSSCSITGFGLFVPLQDKSSNSNLKIEAWYSQD